MREAPMHSTAKLGKPAGAFRLRSSSNNSSFCAEGCIKSSPSLALSTSPSPTSGSSFEGGSSSSVRAFSSGAWDGENWEGDEVDDSSCWVLFLLADSASNLFDVWCCSTRGGVEIRGCLNALDFRINVFRGPRLPAAVEGDACWDFFRCAFSGPFKNACNEDSCWDVEGVGVGVVCVSFPLSSSDSSSLRLDNYGHVRSKSAPGMQHNKIPASSSLLENDSGFLVRTILSSSQVSGTEI